MRKRLKLLAITILVLMIITSVGAYIVWMVGDNEAEEYVTGEKWASSTWRVEAPSYAETSNGSLPFRAMAYQPSEDTFGVSLIQQGDSPHGWWNLSVEGYGLRNEMTIYTNNQQPFLTLDFEGKRISQIEWFTNDTGEIFNNIGILLVGDVGLDYYNDTFESRALYIDIWLDTNPLVPLGTGNHWQQKDGVERDYHSGFSVQAIPEMGKEYEFKVRIDPYIRDSLNYWKLEWFKLKMVQCYIEAKASKASLEVSRVLITTP